MEIDFSRSIYKLADFHLIKERKKEFKKEKVNAKLIVIVMIEVTATLNQ